MINSLRQMVWFPVASALLLMAAINPVGAQEAAELEGVFREYNAAAKAGDVEKMLSRRTAASQKEIRGQITTEKDRQFFLVLSRAQIPESYRVEHISRGKDGRKALLYLLAQFPAMPGINRPRLRQEGMLTFKKEARAWKIESFLPLGDPDKIQRPGDLAYDPRESDVKVFGQIGGRIVKTEFRPSYTLVLLRVMDEEHAVFLPPKGTLLKSGVPLADLAPWKRQIFRGHPHKSDKLKFFATGAEPLED